MARTALLIGQAPLCRRIEQQLALLPESERPQAIGWIDTAPGTDADSTTGDSPRAVRLGSLDALEDALDRHAPDVALISLPATLSAQVASIRTRLRKRGVPDRFMPTLEDQIDGVGPRTHIDIDPTQLIDRPPRLIDEAAVRRTIEGKIVLITGAGGSIGGELARLCARFGPQRLLLMDRSENALFEIDRQIARSHPGLARKAVLHDVVDAAGTRRIFKHHLPQVIFHAAAHKHVPMMEDHPGAAIDNNLFGTKSVADAAHETRAERFVMISTDKAVNPSSIMGATKRLAELYVQFADADRVSETAFSIVRFGNVLGSSGSVLETWSRQIAEGGPVTVTDRRMTRYFMTIPEAASLVVQTASLTADSAEHGEVFLLDMGEPVNILELARRFIALHGLESRLSGENAPAGPSGAIDIVITGARPGEKLHESLAFDSEAMQTTRHPDINIWRLNRPDRRYIERILIRLDPNQRPQDADALAGFIRGLVPEMTPSVAA